MSRNIIKFPNNNIEVNNQQYRIITYDKNKSISIISCAGSGKTLTITAKIAYMIYQYNCNPDEFFIATFTRNAAKDMKERINSFIGQTDIYCGTFHSLGMKILNYYDFQYIDNNNHVDETQYLFYDFLKSDKSFTFKKKIKYIFVDEFQDINDIQYNIINELYSFCISIIIVGDDCQNIYNFRGSNIKYILNCDDEFPNIETFKLTINYRSNISIVNLANEIIKKNHIKIDKKMLASNKNQKKPIIHKLNSLFDEIKYIALSIKKDINENNMKPEDIAVLSRNNQPLFYIEEFLTMLKIKNIFISSDFKSTRFLQEDYITLSTIHSAKGLEWKKVYLMGMNEEFFPSKKDISSNILADIEEERRLFYVGVTRCQNDLILTFNKNGKPSQFLTELNPDLFNQTGECVYIQESENISNAQYNFELPNIDISVTSLIKRLNGEDYIKLKEKKIIDSFEFNTKKVYESFIYPDFVKKHDFYTDFGCFVDYLIRRMIADRNIHNNTIKTKGYHDSRADTVLISVYLDKIQYKIYLEYYNLFELLVKSKLNNKISPTEKNNLKKNINDIAKKNYIAVQNIDIICDIFTKILNKSKQYCVSPYIVKVINKIYLPSDHVNKMKLSYLKYINKKNKWSDIVWDILQVSKCHHISSGRRKSLYVDVTESDIMLCSEWYEQIEKFIDKYMFKEGKERVAYCNPTLSNNYISGDADLIIGSTLIDIKNSNSKELNIEHLLQLLIYTKLARDRNYEIDYITIFNPLLGIVHNCNISKWNKGNELLTFLYDKI